MTSVGANKKGTISGNGLPRGTKVKKVWEPLVQACCIRCGPDEERILDVVPREDGTRNSG